MRKYVCSICGFVYDEAVGIPEAGIAPGTRWEELPDSWVCPLCGATKAEFVEQGAKARPASDPSNGMASDEADETLREMSAGELSALCSNLAKGCEKQYKHEEAELFHVLADYYEAKSAPASAQVFSDLFALIEQDLSSGFPNANEASKANADRGALRALTWGEKVTRILNGLISRYEREGDAMLEGTNVYVCEICGFIYVGDEPPAICPICKVPNMKLEQVRR